MQIIKTILIKIEIYHLLKFYTLFYLHVYITRNFDI